MKAICAVAVLPVLLASCTAQSPAPTPSISPTTAPAAETSAAPAPVSPRTVEFIDLQVGDCVANLPPNDLSSVDVDIVDCASRHLAEVFARKDIAVDTAVTNIADKECEAAFTPYSGQPQAGGPYSVTYLIDSNQDRTSNNPLPSTVICLLQARDGTALTGSAHA